MFDRIAINWQLMPGRCVRRSLGVAILAFASTNLTLPQELPIFRGDATIVTVPSTVQDQHGLAVNGLASEDFRLFVDGVPAAIEHLWKDSDLPLRLVIINDVSDSQREQLSRKKDAIAYFLQRVIRGADQAFVVEVNSEVVLRAHVSAGPYGLRYSVLPSRGESLGVPCGTLSSDHGRQRPVCGGTALWNAVYAVARLKLAGNSGNNAMIILSDGIDTGSTHTFDEAMEEISRSGTVVYALRFPDAMSPDNNSEQLKRLADRTGGLFIDALRADYGPLFSRIESDLRGRYVLAFRPDSRGRERGIHSLKVETTISGASVRSRQEYAGLD